MPNKKKFIVEEPPPARLSKAGQGAEIRSDLEELAADKELRGKFVRFREFGRPATASSYAARIRSGEFALTGGLKPDDFEFEPRRTPDEQGSILWVKCVKED